MAFYGKTAVNNLVDIVDEFSFENQSKRKQGEEDNQSFLRKGIAGDWKVQFTSRSSTLFQQYAGQTLIDLGYEENDNWAYS